MINPRTAKHFIFIFQIFSNCLLGGGGVTERHPYSMALLSGETKTIAGHLWIKLGGV